MRTWIGSLAVSVALLASASAAQAATSRAEVRKQVEASMLVQGTVDIDQEGRVTTYRLEQISVLPKAMLDIVDHRIRAWRFEPVLVGGKAVPARAPMQVRLVTRQDGENYRLEVAGASFGDDAYEKDEIVRSRGKLRPPPYPSNAVYAGVGGTVYLVLRIGRDGAVEDGVAEQVNLHAVGFDRQMTAFRDLLAKAALKTSRSWRFDFPTRGEDADAPFLSVRVPVTFIAPGEKDEEVGKWQAYVPGPRQPVPWRNWDASFDAPDALAAGGIYPDRPGSLKLLRENDG
jgi:hypothetical protein